MTFRQLNLDSGKEGLITTEYFTFNIDGGDYASLVVSTKVTAVSAGINAGNPALLTLEASFDSGASYAAVATYCQHQTDPATLSISKAGVYLIKPASPTFLSPYMRFVITVPAGETITIERPQRTSAGEGTSPSVVSLTGLSVSASTAFDYGSGGSYAGVAPTFDATVSANNLGLPVVTLTKQGGAPVDFTTLTSDVTTLTSDVGTIKTDIGTIATDINTIVTTAAAIQGDTADISSNTAQALLRETVVGVSRTVHSVTAIPATPAAAPFSAPTFTAHRIQVWSSTGYSWQLTNSTTGEVVMVPPGGQDVPFLVNPSDVLNWGSLTGANLTLGETVIDFIGREVGGA